MDIFQMGLNNNLGELGHACFVWFVLSNIYLFLFIKGRIVFFQFNLYIIPLYLG